MEHETGAHPVICFIDRNTVVQFRSSWGLDNDLWYYVGTIGTSGAITWGGAERPNWHGRNCRVAINNEGRVVEMHQSLTHRRIYSRVGVVKEGKISWGECQRVEDGMNPAVALLDDGTVICVYLTSSQGSYSSYSRVGFVKVESKAIVQWEDPTCYGTGRNLALTANRGGVVIEMHQKAWRMNTLQYRVGKLHNSHGQKQITWGEEIDCGGGWDPSVTLNSDGNVLEVHSTFTLRRLQYRNGVVDSNAFRIDWTRDAIQYDLGKYPSVCLNGNRERNVVEAHETNLGISVWCCSGSLNKS